MTMSAQKAEKHGYDQLRRYHTVLYTILGTVLIASLTAETPRNEDLSKDTPRWEWNQAPLCAREMPLQQEPSSLHAPLH